MLKRFLVIPAIALVASACASASAKAPVERPALNVPPPPPRVIEPAVEPDPEPVGDLPSQPPASPPARSNRSNSRESRPQTESKPEAKPPESRPAEVAPIPEPPPPTTPPAQLRTPQTADTTGAAKNVQSTIDRAMAALNTVDYRVLSAERRKAYDDAKRFIQQAEQGLKQGNLVFAQGAATKGETLAKELAGR
jgi:outer membrane biosynthesis protein TonB